jgi:hypothetical protein
MTTIEDDNKKCSVAKELEKLNKLFAKRYTDEDKEYVQTVKTCSTNPPIVDDWDQQNQRRYYSNNQYRNYSYDNRYRRDRNRSPPHYYDQRR